jgi:hypothetical protein
VNNNPEQTKRKARANKKKTRANKKKKPEKTLKSGI